MKTLSFIFFVLITLPVFAQDDDLTQRYPNAREKINAARAAYITERLSLTPEEAEKFWPLYREYSQKRQDLRKQYRMAKKSGQDEKSLLDLDLKIKQQELDLEKDYSDKFQKVISPQKLVQLHEAEDDFRRLIIRQIEQRQGRMERRQRLREEYQQKPSVPADN
jgi:hypothetical protein